MTTDKKTLATAKPGGCVQLKDAAAHASPAHDPETVERVAKAMQASENAQSGWTWADCSSIEVEGWMDLARAAVAALSAQPSPGGQDAARYERLFLSAVEMLTKISLRLGLEPNSDGVEPMLAAIDALAARQPVEVSEGGFRAAASRQTASAESNATAEALIAAARQPVGEIPSEVLSAISGLAHIAKANVPSLADKHVAIIDAWLYAAPPAQAVGLEQFRPAVCAMGLYAEEPEDVDEANRLLALIDSQAVGNG